MIDTFSDLEQALESAGPAATRERVDALNALAWEVGFTNVHRTAELAQEAISLARELSYPHGIAWGLLNDAFRDYFIARYDVAMSKALESLEIFEGLEEPRGIGNVRIGLGLIFWSLGDYELAVSHLHAANELFHDIGDTDREAWGLTSLGGVYESVGDLDKSIECQTRALELFRSNDDGLGVSRALTGIGSVYQRQGEPDSLDKALDHHFKSLELARLHALRSKQDSWLNDELDHLSRRMGETGHGLAESRALNDIGTIYLAKGELDKAESYLTQGLEIRRALGSQSAEITSLLDLGALFIKRGDAEQAIVTLTTAFDFI